MALESASEFGPGRGHTLDVVLFSSAGYSDYPHFQRTHYLPEGRRQQQHPPPPICQVRAELNSVGEFGRKYGTVLGMRRPRTRNAAAQLGQRGRTVGRRCESVARVDEDRFTVIWGAITRLLWEPGDSNRKSLKSFHGAPPGSERFPSTIRGEPLSRRPSNNRA